MRDRKILMETLSEWKAKSSHEGLILEVLIDIRDLLAEGKQ